MSANKMVDAFEATSELQEDVEELRRGGTDELACRFTEFRGTLTAMVRSRMDDRMAGRVDASDIVQETFLEACRRLPEYVDSPKLPLLKWLRRLGIQTLAKIRRTHLHTQMRDAIRDQQIRPSSSDYTCKLARELSASITSPSGDSARIELAERVRVLLDSMEAHDRQILGLKHLEGLSLKEAATEIGISVEAAKKRYRRALRRLTQLATGLDS